ncbi:MAG: hypothetical protein KAV87_42130, partial [Desulfobacteraceae bacterium]|nr:hypothetical protein [Desulfobacteraceae bacterium]
YLLIYGRPQFLLLPCRSLFLKTTLGQGSQASYAQNPNISARLEKNAFLTIRAVSVIRIPVPVVGCRMMIAGFFPALLHIGMHPVMAHNLKFSLIPLSKRKFL